MSPNPPRIFDPSAYRTYRRRAALKGGDLFLAEEATSHIAERLAAVNRNFVRGLDLNSRARLFPLIEPFAQTWVRTGNSAESPSVISDDNRVPFANEKFDLVVSILSLHAVNDLPGTLIQIRRLLQPDGLFIAALFAGETLSQLRFAFASAEAETLGGVSPHVSPFADIRDLGDLLQRADFSLPVADVERTVMRYRNIDRLFTDIRALGESNALVGRRPSLTSRRLVHALMEEYGARFSGIDGCSLATFDIAYLTGWAAHENQPKPLKPGSARMRLADAIRTIDVPGSEKK